MNLEGRCIVRVKECISIAQKHFKVVINRPTIDFNKKGRVAGTANYSRWNISLNRGLLEENVEHFIEHTVAHEAAHLIAVSLYGKKGAGHGKRWKSVMNVLGIPADRCHSYDVASVSRLKTFEYMCDCTIYQLTSIRHNRILKGKQTYHCKKCGCNLEGCY